MLDKFSTSDRPAATELRLGHPFPALWHHGC